MTVSEFFYWLQGFFELSFPAPTLTPMQAECILRHAELVEATNSDLATLPSRFYEVRGLARAVTRAATAEDVRSTLTREIQTIVAGQFEHVIDPAAGDAEQQATLNHLHHGGKPGARC